MMLSKYAKTLPFLFVVCTVFQVLPFSDGQLRTLQRRIRQWREIIAKNLCIPV
ncbi:MAG: hypothetical protein GWO26_28565 [Phycisphaerae bacterium]|nr:hypothetical protein [Phycisphaerae bacterium]